MSKKRSMKKGIVLFAAATICIIGTTVFAAYRYLSAEDFANHMGDKSLARYFSENSMSYETVTDGEYKAAFLGIVSGEKLSSLQTESVAELHPDRTYAVVAVEKTDGSDITFDDDICITPLIQGYNPWQLNIATMHGMYSEQIIDGVRYRMIECDNIEYFADRQLYLAVTDSVFIDNRQFKLDKTTGLISANENYTGTNILFDLKLDKSKANPQKAAEYLNSVQAENNTEEEPPN